MGQSDISLIIFRRKHQLRSNYQDRSHCPFKFETPGTVLPHASYPQGDGCIEIHFDGDKNWYYNMYVVSTVRQPVFLGVTVHEIGHNSGITHSPTERDFMFV